MTILIDDEDLPAYPPVWLVHFRRTLATIERENRLRKYQRDTWILAEARRIERERRRAGFDQEGRGR